MRVDNLNKDSSVHNSSLNLSVKTESDQLKSLISNATDTTLDKKYKRIMNLNKRAKRQSPVDK